MGRPRIDREFYRKGAVTLGRHEAGMANSNPLFVFLAPLWLSAFALNFFT